MSKRVYRAMGLVACGFSLQLFGCQARQINAILADGIKATAVEVSTFTVESLIDQALGLNN